MDDKHGRTTSGVTCHHCLWTAHTIERCRAGIPSSPLDSTHSRMTSGVIFHHRLSTTHTVGLRRAWNDITALVQHTWSNDVWRGMTSPPLDSTHSRQRRVWHAITALGQHRWSDDVRRDMPSPPLDSTHGRTMSGVALHHRPWTARMVGRRRAWYDIIAL